MQKSYTMQRSYYLCQPMKKRSLHELGRASIEIFQNTPKLPVVLVLDNVRSMHNVGSIFRSADCFAVSQLYLCGITACPPHRDIEKTALGATLSVPWQHHANTADIVQLLKKEGYLVYALEQTTASVDLQQFTLTPQQRYAFVLGNEVAGVQNEVLGWVDGCVEIPQFGTKHSFNVSVTAGILLWDVWTKLH